MSLQLIIIIIIIIIMIISIYYFFWLILNNLKSESLMSVFLETLATHPTNVSRICTTLLNLNICFYPNLGLISNRDLHPRKYHSPRIRRQHHYHHKNLRQSANRAASPDHAFTEASRRSKDQNSHSIPPRQMELWDRTSHMRI